MGYPDMDALVAVFITTRNFGLPHLDSFRRHNPEVPIYCIVAEENPSYERGWMNCDRNVRDWWISYGRHLDFEYALFIEGDVLFSCTVEEVFCGDSHFMGKDVKKPGMSWNWFSHIPNLPEDMKVHATGLAPLAVMRMSKVCLSEMFSHPLVETLYGREIFCELRLPTLAAACGHEPENHSGKLDNLHFYPVIPKGGGVWHCVKGRLES